MTIKTSRMTNFIQSINTLLILCFIPGAQPAGIPTSVSVSAPSPVEGSRVAFTCNFSVEEGDILAQIVWSYGPTLSGSDRIVDWTYDEPDNVNYYGDYSAPTYTMSTTDISSGQTVLAIDPVQLSDEGRYWCEVSVFGKSGHANVNIEVIDKDGEYYVDEGDSLILSCALPGSSALIHYIWRKYDTQLGTVVPIAFWDIIVEVPMNADNFPFPNYKMTIDVSSGSSNLTIMSIVPQDDATYMCEASYIPTLPGGDPKKEIRVFVLDGPMLPNVTLSMSTAVAANPTTDLLYQGTTMAKYMTTDITGHLNIYRLEATVIEVRWESFQVVGDEIDQYRVFYSVGLHTNGSDSSVVFLNGKEEGVILSDLIPATLYSIRVEASTRQGRLVEVGNIKVTTTSDTNNATGFTNVIITVGSIVTVVLIIVIALVVICWIRWRRSSLQKEAPDIEYQNPQEDPMYQELQTATQERPHDYESPVVSPPLPAERNVKQSVQYEVSPIAPEYDYEVPEPIPEYLELDDIESPAKSNQEKSKESSQEDAQYIGLNKDTMDNPKHYQALTLPGNTATSSVS